MPKIYTPNDLIRFIYNETDTHESLEISQGVQSHPKAAEDLEQFRSVIRELDAMDLEPDPTSVSLILEYSQKSHVAAH